MGLHHVHETKVAIPHSLTLCEHGNKLLTIRGLLVLSRQLFFLACSRVLVRVLHCVCRSASSYLPSSRLGLKVSSVNRIAYWPLPICILLCQFVFSLYRASSSACTMPLEQFNAMETIIRIGRFTFLLPEVWWTVKTAFMVNVDQISCSHGTLMLHDIEASLICHYPSTSTTDMYSCWRVSMFLKLTYNSTQRMFDFYCIIWWTSHCV